ncbi:hypothetical protein [Magnetospira sp. QH-2]|uniref:hypothetical protein n=1 Tax=Magnetospira sp. (strain QH-2) TaxID=1288970 RepID=UPI0003E81033|nr:hypothetical protein [Magnetospira sp. QH-2]CCQ72324.1 conserved protein of unknown function [Magnetospira sp. QH-2]
MSNMKATKTSFAAGEVSPRLLGRGDLRSFENGAKTLRNVFIFPTGGLTRRPGLRHVDSALGKGRLVPFEFNTEQVYLLHFTDQTMTVFKDGAKVLDDGSPLAVTMPWTEEQLAQINWTQSADTLLVVHPDVAPQKITRTSDEDWTITEWTYLDEEDDDKKYNRLQQPFHKFADDEVTVTPSGTAKDSTVTVSASADVFTADHVGQRLRIANKELEITTFTSATVVSATVKEALVDTQANKDWEEQAFSINHGWPVSCCFHQDRLVIGGSRDLPNRLWMSKSADLFNFDLGEGLDDESIEFAILSDQVNAIRAVFSGRHLQVFTSGAEWMVTGYPLTPENVQLNRQTRIGSPVDRTVPPRDVDGATLFIPRGGPGVHEYLFTDVEQAYQSSDLAMLAHHIMGKTTDQDFDQQSRILHFVQEDGGLVSLTLYRTQEVTAWSRQSTDGLFESVAVAGERTYVAVNRNGIRTIEYFDDTLSLDGALTGADTTPKTTWTGLDHLEGRDVKVVADGAPRDSVTVSNGAITLDYAASEVEVGLPYTHIVEPLPPSLAVAGSGGQGGRVRLISATFRLQDTLSLRLDVGRGLVEVPFQRFGAAAFDTAWEPFTGDKTIRAFGWKDGDTESLWRIESDAPLPFTLLSVVAEMAVNG